jgi:hypothetical protein
MDGVLKIAVGAISTTTHRIRFWQTLLTGHLSLPPFYLIEAALQSDINRETSNL